MYSDDTILLSTVTTFTDEQIHDLAISNKINSELTQITDWLADVTECCKNKNYD